MSICANEAYTAEATTDVLAILFSEFILIRKRKKN